MGVVWRARDLQLERAVAVKLLHDRYLGADHQHQIVREARAMARLAHPNVVAVYDAGELEGRGFVAMELVRGEPLTRWLETPRTWQEIVAVFRSVAAGLAAAHAAGILHRDVKPSNILIGDDGRPRLVDFGVAHTSTAATLDGDAPLTATTTGLIGSPAYMSLERLCGEPADERGDQFSFCVALYEALHGRRPFDAPTIGGTIAAIARGVPPPVRDVPRWLEDAIVRGLAVKPDDRFPSMIALDAALAGPPRRTRTRTLGLAAAAAAAATIATIAIAVAWPRDDDGAPATPAASSTPATADAPHPDAAPAAVATATVEPDAGVDAATAADARPAPRRTSPPAAPLTAAEEVAAMKELRASWMAAIERGDHRAARAFAEKAIAVIPSHPDPRTVAATSSCRLGDEKRARAHLAKLPRSQGMARISVVRICRRLGFELDDLLTESESLGAR